MKLLRLKMILLRVSFNLGKNPKIFKLEKTESRNFMLCVDCVRSNFSFFSFSSDARVWLWFFPAGKNVFDKVHHVLDKMWECCISEAKFEAGKSPPKTHPIFFG